VGLNLLKEEPGSFTTLHLKTSGLHFIVTRKTQEAMTKVSSIKLEDN
jgi:hypothetical protein